MDLIRRGRVSTGKVCELLGLDRLAFVRRAAEVGVPVDLTTKEEWKANLGTQEARKRRS